MRSIYIFLILISVTMGVLLWMSYALPFAEAMIGVGLLLLLCGIEVWLYFSLVRPVRLLSKGFDLIVSQDYASRLRPVKQYDADKLVHTFNTLIERLRDERLRRQERNEFLSLLIDESPTGIIIFDYNGRITDVNPAAAKTLRLAGTSYRGAVIDMMDSERARLCSDVSLNETRVIRMSDTEIIRCSRHNFIDKGAERQFLIIENMTDEVRQAEKEAYHRVIRMLAHEVNNTMCGLTTTIDALDYAIGDDSEIHDLLVGCHDRCGALSSFITSYASVVKIPQPLLCRCDLNEVVRHQRQFLESIVSPVPLAIEYAPMPVMVMLDVAQWEQVMVNIVKNASESIGDTPGGLVSLNINHHPKSIVVTDNGNGISDEAAAHLFSPFFSTKSQGNGLGLIVISEILQRHGCTFSLQTSKVDGLTRFSIIFPTA